MKLINLLFVILTIFIHNRLLADEIISCDYCTSTSQFKSRAIQDHLQLYGSLNSKIETYQVVNANTAKVTAVYLRHYYEPEYNSNQITSAIVASNPVLVYEVNDLKTALSSAPDGIQIPSTVEDTIFDVLKDTRAEGQISNYIAMSQTWDAIAT